MKHIREHMKVALKDMTREERREAMPLVYAFISDIRKHLGEDSIVSIKAEENGHKAAWTKR